MSPQRVAESADAISFLRWKAVQDAAFVDPDDGITKCWSETHVSEDFDQSLRLQMKGWSLRWASYSNGGFQEGVSLTCDDEVSCSACKEHRLTNSSTAGKSTATVARSFFSIPSASGSPKVQSPSSSTASYGPTFLCTPRFPSSLTFPPTTLSLAPCSCPFSTGS